MLVTMFFINIFINLLVTIIFDSHLIFNGYKEIMIRECPGKNDLR